jgi:hypothetical protein
MIKSHRVLRACCSAAKKVVCHPDTWRWIETYEMTRPGMNIHQAAVLEYLGYQGFAP